MSLIRKRQPTNPSRSFFNLNRAYHLVALIALISGLLNGCSKPTQEKEAALEQLALSFRTANQASSIEPMFALYHTVGADERTIQMLRGALKYELGLPIQSIGFEPLSGAPEENIDFVHDGVAYGPSLQPKMRMEVIYQSDDGFTSLFTVGHTDEGTWRIVCAKPIATPPPTLSQTPAPR